MSSLFFASKNGRESISTSVRTENDPFTFHFTFLLFQTIVIIPYFIHDMGYKYDDSK